jgi:hypothetical protein
MRIIYFLLLFPSFIFSQISVDTSFEGANAHVISINNSTNTLKFESVKRRGDIHNVVFYFKVSGIDTTRQFKLQIKYTQQYYLPELLAYSYDNLTWYRINGIFTSDSKEYTNTYIRKTVYFSHSYPYTYSKLLELADSLNGNQYTQISNISVSELGRQVKLFRITDSGVRDSSKQLIWIIGRNHAMEHHSNYVLEGLINFLLSSDANAARLRTQAIIYIVPVMDVDMAALGGTGKDQNPVDFNRDWDSPSYWNAIKDVKTKILQTSALNRLRIFIDSHNPFPSSADSSSRLFFYSLYSDGNKSNNLNLFRAFLFQNGGYYWARQPMYPTSGQTSSRWVDSVFNYIDFSTSLETGWVNRPDGNPWTLYFYRKNGEIMGKGLSDYIYQTTSVSENFIPATYSLSVYPNPFNGVTNFVFSLSQTAQTELEIFDIRGLEIFSFYFGILQQGTYKYQFDSVDLPSGIYFYNLKSRRFHEVGKLILLK